MKIVFVSNFLNHHQTFLCEAFIKRCSSFTFVATQDVSNVGFQASVKRDYVACYYNADERQDIERKIVEADVVIFGACPNHLISLRMQENKLSFLFSERVFKKGTWRRFIPKTRKTVWDRIAQYKDKNMYVLCASAYLSYDLSFFGFPEEKCLRWGYFTEIKEQDENKLFSNKDKATLLWCGRFLRWKHPETAIQVARRLKKDGYNFTLTFIGSGELEYKIRKDIKKYGLTNHVTLVGAKTPEEVRAFMEQSQIFLGTSDRKEGWGAVVGEAMNSGCAVVATQEMGAVFYLIQDGENGRVFRAKRDKQAYRLVKKLLDNEKDALRLGSCAYATMKNEWNPDNAVDKLLQVVEKINKGLPYAFENGVCAQADRIKG